MADFAASVDRVLSWFEAQSGETITYEQETGRTFDPSTRTYIGGATSSTPTPAVVMPFTREEIASGAVEASDLQAFLRPDALSAAGVTPRTGDTVLRGGERYRATVMETYPVSGAPAAYRLRLQGVA